MSENTESRSPLSLSRIIVWGLALVIVLFMGLYYVAAQGLPEAEKEFNTIHAAVSIEGVDEKVKVAEASAVGQMNFFSYMQRWVGTDENQIEFRVSVSEPKLLGPNRDGEAGKKFGIDFTPLKQVSYIDELNVKFYGDYRLRHVDLKTLGELKGVKKLSVVASHRVITEKDVESLLSAAAELLGLEVLHISTGDFTLNLETKMLYPGESLSEDRQTVEGEANYSGILNEASRGYLAKMTDLVELKIQVGNDDCDIFANLPALKTLDLDGSRLGLEGAKKISELQNLASLDVGYTLLHRNEEIAAILKEGLPETTTLLPEERSAPSGGRGGEGGRPPVSGDGGGGEGSGGGGRSRMSGDGGGEGAGGGGRARMSGGGEGTGGGGRSRMSDDDGGEGAGGRSRMSGGGEGAGGGRARGPGDGGGEGGRSGGSGDGH
ncbi:MAG: hypothetical protein MPJ24_04215 [Pirellulaceae bacterium]|nr:hypothetical protein [Pirellulaceae bacterium]